MEEELFQSLEDFDAAARSLWNRGLAASIEADRPMPTGHPVRFTVYVDRSLPSDDLKRLWAQRQAEANPRWRIHSPELNALLDRCADASGRAPLVRIQLIKGQGAVGEWSLTASNTPIASDVELARLLRRVLSMRT